MGTDGHLSYQVFSHLLQQQLFNQLQTNASPAATYLNQDWSLQHFCWPRTRQRCSTQPILIATFCYALQIHACGHARRVWQGKVFPTKWYL